MADSKKKDNRFLSNLVASDKGLKRSRAENLAKRVKNEQEHLVRTLENEVLDLESKIDRHSDLGPKQTTDLKVADIDAQNWVSELHKLTVQLENTRLELDIAQSNYSNWFE